MAFISHCNISSNISIMEFNWKPTFFAHTLSKDYSSLHNGNLPLHILGKVCLILLFPTICSQLPSLPNQLCFALVNAPQPRGWHIQKANCTVNAHMNGSNFILLATSTNPIWASWSNQTTLHANNLNLTIGSPPTLISIGKPSSQSTTSNAQHPTLIQTHNRAY